LFDKKLNWELVDQSAGHVFNGFVHEQVGDTAHEWPRHLLYRVQYDAPLAEIPDGWKTDWRAEYRRAERVVAHKAQRTPLGWMVEQQLEAPGISGLLTQRVFLPDYADWIECSASWDMGLTVHPEATYLLYPFNVPDAVARYDVGGQSVIPGEEQLPRVCRDYFTVQGWVDFSNDERGVTIAVPDNPMVQLGDFHFGHYQPDFQLERAMLLGWVTNNYWGTNFRAQQAWLVQARYRIQAHEGPYEEAQPHRFGLEAAYNQPVIQHLHESTAGDPILPGQGALLRLPESPVLTLHNKRAEDGNGLIVRLLNASDSQQTAVIQSRLLRIQSASCCDLLEDAGEELAVADGAVSLEIPARRVAAGRLQLE